MRKMTMGARTNPRLMKEYRDLTADPINDTLTAGPVSEDNMLEWEALIQGPEDTPYVSGLVGCCGGKDGGGVERTRSGMQPGDEGSSGRQVARGAASLGNFLRPKPRSMLIEFR